MRYEELPGPLEGWTYDENGTIYTASGYKTTARQIEFCMWMYDCLTAEARRWMIRSDERPGTLRPLFESTHLHDAHATMANSGATTATTDRGKASQRKKANRQD